MILESNYRVIRSFLPREIRIIAVVSVRAKCGVIQAAQVWKPGGITAVAILEERWSRTRDFFSHHSPMGFRKGKKRNYSASSHSTVYDQEVLQRLGPLLT
jgi:hypothetical protein